MFHATFSRRVVVCLFSLPALLVAALAFTAAQPPATRGDEAAVRAALETKISLELQEVPLSDVAALLSEKLKINVVLNVRSLEISGINTDLPCTLKLNDVTARSALNQLSREVGELGWRTRRWGVELLTKDDVQRRVSTRATDVSALLPAADPRFVREREDLAAELQAAIQLACDPQIGWLDDGGIGRLNIDNSSNLIVSSVDDTHEEVERFLTMLRSVVTPAPANPSPSVKGKTGPSVVEPRPAGPPPTSLPAPTDSEKKLLAKFAQKLDVDFQATPLTEVVDFFASKCQIPILLDRRAMESYGIGMDAPVTLKLKGARFDDLLEAVLEKLELQFLIRDESLLITTRDECEKATIVRVYLVSDFAPTENSDVARELLGDLIKLVEEHTNHPTPGWEDDGGVGKISMLTFPKALVVRTTSEAHEEVEAFIGKLRAARGNRPVNVPKELRVVTLNYSFNALTRVDPNKVHPNKALELVMLQLEGIEFDQNRHSVHVVGETVVIKHTTAVHRHLSRRFPGGIVGGFGDTGLGGFF